MFASVQAVVYLALALGAFAFELWALIQSLRYSNEQYYAAGKRNKAFWTAVLGAAAAVGFLGLPYPLGQSFSGPLGIVGIVAVVAAAVFAVDVRPALESTGPTSKHRRDHRGGW